MLIAPSPERRHLVAPLIATGLAALALASCSGKPSHASVDTTKMTHAEYSGGGMFSGKLYEHPWSNAGNSNEVKDDQCFNADGSVGFIDENFVVLTEDPATKITWAGVPLAAFDTKVTKDCANPTGFAWLPVEHLSPAPQPESN